MLPGVAQGRPLWPPAVSEARRLDHAGGASGNAQYSGHRGSTATLLRHVRVVATTTGNAQGVGRFTLGVGAQRLLAGEQVPLAIVAQPLRDVALEKCFSLRAARFSPITRAGRPLRSLGVREARRRAHRLVRPASPVSRRTPAATGAQQT